jgi:hypothetical protein
MKNVDGVNAKLVLILSERSIYNFIVFLFKTFFIKKCKLRPNSKYVSRVFMIGIQGYMQIQVASLMALMNVTLSI